MQPVVQDLVGLVDVGSLFVSRCPDQTLTVGLSQLGQSAQRAKFEFGGHLRLAYRPVSSGRLDNNIESVHLQIVISA